MNKLCPLITLMLTVCLLQACNSHTKSNGSDTISNADSLNAVKDTSTVSVPITNEDAKFVIKVASSGLTEIELGKLALQRGQNKRVKNFGGLMAKDITKTLNKLKKIAQNKHINLPTAPLAADQKIIDSLTKLSGRQFDNAYVNLMITGRKRYVTVFESEAKNSGDPDIKSFANKTLTPIKNHLDAINTIYSSMK